MIEINFEEYFDSVLVSGKLEFEKKKRKEKRKHAVNYFFDDKVNR